MIIRSILLSCALFLSQGARAQNGSTAEDLRARIRAETCSYVEREVLPKIATRFEQALACDEAEKNAALQAITQQEYRLWGRTMGLEQVNEVLEQLANAWVESFTRPAAIPTDYSERIRSAQRNYVEKEKEILQRSFPAIGRIHSDYVNTEYRVQRSLEEQMGSGLPRNTRVTVRVRSQMENQSVWDNFPSWMGGTNNPQVERIFADATTSRLWTSTDWLIYPFSRREHNLREYQRADLPFNEITRNRILESRAQNYLQFSACLIEGRSLPASGIVPCVFVTMPNLRAFLQRQSTDLDAQIETGAVSFRSQGLAGCEAPQTLDILRRPYPRAYTRDGLATIAPQRNAFLNNAFVMGFLLNQNPNMSQPVYLSVDRYETTLERLFSEWGLTPSDQQFSRICAQVF